VIESVIETYALPKNKNKKQNKEKSKLSEKRPSKFTHNVPFDSTI
jgi:hypothetical protein